jgi:hypothetical protein
MVCTLYSMLNEASRYYKDKHCDAANYDYTWDFFEWAAKQEKNKKRRKRSNAS